MEMNARSFKMIIDKTNPDDLNIIFSAYCLGTTKLQEIAKLLNISEDDAAKGFNKWLKEMPPFSKWDGVHRPSWISVKDKLPEYGQLVLCCILLRDKQEQEIWCWQNEWSEPYTNYPMPESMTVTHWQPLLPLPKRQ